MRSIWLGEDALFKSYPRLLETDIPFGQDALGDQFFLRDGQVYYLASETGDIENFAETLSEFLEKSQLSPTDYLALEPLADFVANGGWLEPGQLMSVYPPFCTKEAGNGVSLKAISAMERLKFLTFFASQIGS